MPTCVLDGPVGFIAHLGGFGSCICLIFPYYSPIHPFGYGNASSVSLSWQCINCFIICFFFLNRLIAKSFL